MKKLGFFLVTALGLVTFSACNESTVKLPNKKENVQVNFSGTIGEMKTRATDNAWDAGDAIGIYALNEGQTLSASSIYAGKENVKYTTDGSVDFSASNTGIEFPKEGNLDFIAYYPYQESLNNYTYNVDVATQSNPAKIDLLYANVKGKNRENGDIALSFEHMLSKLVFKVKIGGGLNSLEGFTASIKDVVTDGTFNLATGKVTTGTVKKTITPIVTIASDKQSATITAIVLPQQDLKNTTIVFTVGGKEYEWQPNAQQLDAKTKYTYPLQLSNGGVVINGTIINDWTEGNTSGSTIVLTPNDGTGGTNSDTTGGTNSDTTGGTDSDTTTTGTPLFSGSDFENWSAFEASLNKYGLNNASQNPNGGMNGSSAMQITGTPAKNIYVLTANVPSSGNTMNGKSKVSFYVKGATPGKTLSFNIYKSTTNSGGYAEFYKFNLGELSTTEVTLASAASNSYTGSIDTQDKWVKVTLDISGLTDLATSGSMFAIKAGKGVEWNVLLDNITVE